MKRKISSEEGEQIKIIFEMREENNDWQTGERLKELALEKLDERMDFLRKRIKEE